MHGIRTVSYNTSPLRLYENGLADPKFFVDVFKLLRWIGSVERLTEQSHILLFRIFRTPNHNYAHLLKDGLHNWHKEGRVVLYDDIEKIYEAPLRHVERGKVIRSASSNRLVISSIGQTLFVRPSSEVEVRERVLTGIFEGLNELHNLGYAHCDVRLTNVFWVVDSESPQGRAILGDLEFMRPRNSNHLSYLNVFPSDMETRTKVAEDLRELDLYQFKVLEHNFPW